VKLATYVFLLIACNIVLYFAGDTNLYTALTVNTGAYASFTDSEGNFTTDAMYGWLFFSVLILAAGVAVAWLSGFGAIYVLALILVFAFLNIFIFPLSLVLDNSTPEAVKALVMLVFNGLLALTIYSEGRGR
jgi:hypothetical protein